MTDDKLPTTAAGHHHTADCECLPIRVVVDQHGHYWRDYGDHWSMCPVSTENVATEPVSEFYPQEARATPKPALDGPCGYPQCSSRHVTDAPPDCIKTAIGQR